MEKVLVLCDSSERHFSIRALFSFRNPFEWVYVFNEDWKRTGVRIIMTDSEPRLEIDAEKALSLGSTGVERVLEASRFMYYVRLFQPFRNIDQAAIERTQNAENAVC